MSARTKERRGAGRPRSSTIRTPTLERILAAAAREFAARGKAGASLDAVAERAGIRRPSLLYHFATKDALYGAVLSATSSRLAESLAKAMAAPGGAERRLDALVGAFESFLKKNPRTAPLILREFLDGGAGDRRALLREIVPVLAGVEAFLRGAAGRRLRPGLPLRAAVLLTVSDLLLRSAAGPMERPIWGAGAPAKTLARVLLLR